ncbi:DUF6279 family lipoprotein [Marichromatium sp. AB32]|uniref:DUF6279 family lipoprotein n=1 Tax=Marichromatium sp. AB32 TaxID=2483363 RepID=UPI000F3B6F55|nr:DUF6279 family lipoprotein [Marichromatium sp. AB32]RNE93604.1 hypothetical protein EBL85_06280 [Marichromatium sp. AB32]
MSRHLGIMVLVALGLLGGGCSRVSLVYDNAPFLTGVYVDHRIDLAPQQLRGWTRALQEVQTRHRREALPRLIALLDGLILTSERGFVRDDLACLMRAAEPIYRQHAELFVDATAPLLVTLTPTQRQRLERLWRERDAERAAPADPERERRKRARRYIRNLGDWTGPLNASQQQLVRELTAAMPRSQPALDAYRASQRTRLMTLLDEGAGEARIAAFLHGWLVEFDAMPAALRRDGERLTEQLVTLAARFGASLDATQRTRLLERLGELRETLQRLQREQRAIVPLPCAG